MPYVVRHTFSPDYDIQRNWSGWIGGAWDSYESAIQDLSEESPLFGSLRDNEKYENLSDEELLEVVAEREQFDVRYNEAYGKWQHVHHDGLSCFELEAETEEEAIAEAEAREFEWHGFGRSTSGEVRLIKKITNTLYLFWAEDTKPE